MKIIIVEDHPAELMMAQNVLSAAGHAVRGVGNAADAFAAIAVDLPDVVLLDVQLPGVDGLTIARKLRNDPRTSGVVLILISAHDEDLIQTGARLSGSDGYILKPISSRTFEERIVAIVQQKQSARLPPMRILIVEDDPTDMKLLSAIMDSSGHHVLGKTSAESAMVEILRQQPAMILLDLRLPGADGLALARLLKQNPATRAIPIVALTAATEMFSREEALAAGCDAYLVKPFETRKLPAQVDALFKRPFSQAAETLS